MSTTSEKDCGEVPNFKRYIENDTTPIGEVKCMLESLRTLYRDGNQLEGHRASIVFLSGLYVGMSLKEKEHYDK